MFFGTCHTKGWEWIFETVLLQRRTINFSMVAECIPRGKLKQMSDL